LGSCSFREVPKRSESEGKNALARTAEMVFRKVGL
jgi:hypothetical protein